MTGVRSVRRFLRRSDALALVVVAVATIALVAGTFLASRRVSSPDAQPNQAVAVSTVSAPAEPTSAGSTRFVSFAGMRNGRLPPIVGSSRFVVVEAKRNAAGMSVRDEELVHGTPAAPNATSYLQLQNGAAAVTRIGATMTFYDGKSGSVALVAWQKSLTGAVRKGRLITRSVPNAGIYFVASVGGWRLGVWDGTADRQVTLAAGDYAATAGYAVSYQVDRAGSTLTVTNPDGAKASITDPRISRWVGMWATWGLLETDPKLTPARISAIWSS